MVIMDNSKERNGSSSPPPPPPIDLEPTSTYDTLVLEYISEMLMEEEEEELGNSPFHDVLALQATEKSLHDALHNINLDTTCRKSLHHSRPSTSGVKKNYRSREDSCNNNADDVLICPSSDRNEQSKGNERDTVLQFISEMLMEEEEELGNNPSCMLHHDLDLQATEKSLHDAIHNINQTTENSGVQKNHYSQEDMSEHHTRSHKQLANNNAYDDDESEKSLYDALHNINLDSESLIGSYESRLLSSESSKGITDAADGPQASLMYPFWVSNTFSSGSGQGGDISPLKTSSSGGKKNRSREDADFSSEHHKRGNKQLANTNSDDEPEPLEMYDDVLLCSNSDCKVHTCGQTAKKKTPLRNEQSKRGPKPRSGGRKKNDDIIDLRSLLMHCAEAMAKVDNKTVNDLLREIRQHSSPKGDGMERLAHYFAYALEARLTCTGTHLYAEFDSKRVTMADILKAYRMFFIACPFRKMTKILTNRTIETLDSRATSLHIIDFGILYGFQWPDLIYALSERPGGPPKLRITGIDFPQPGFRPAERVAATGRRLAKWADRFGVPFEFNVIAQKWDTITLEDLKIEKYHELVVVNCMYRLHNVPDETVSKNSPRDDVLNLIKKIHPEIFIHGVSNGTFNTPFFVPRFREALFHFSAMFDMFDATMPRDDEYRMLFEEQIFGKEAMNIIACEGTERVERPETYKQWQARSVRVGFRQVSIDKEIVNYLSTMKTGYHKSFSVEEDGKWVLLGWKGRVIKAFSCWRPTHNQSSS